MTLSAIDAKAMTKPIASAKLGVKRGEASWTNIYIWLAITLQIIGVVASVAFSDRVWGMIFFAITAGITFYLFLLSGRFQNWLIGRLNKLHSAER